jgi:hypothetical protein
MAHLNGKQYLSWEDYIQDKFPKALFDINIETKGASSVLRITDKKKISKTEIVVDLVQQNACRVTLFNPESQAVNKDSEIERSKEMQAGENSLTNELLQRTDDYINIALYRGWTERTYYYKERFWRSEFMYFEDGDWKTFPLETEYPSWINRRGGLLVLVTWPLLLIQHGIMRRRIRDSKLITMNGRSIPPMIHLKEIIEER